jgi:biotin transport system substrate-specific component
MRTIPAPNDTSTGPLDTLISTLPGKIALTVAASIVVAACAHLSFPLPFTPVPLTLSDLAVLLVGLMLGPQLAFAALALYLAEGASGLPVFSPAGPGGLAQFVITGGYLVAYPFAAALAGFVARSLKALPRFAAGAAAAFAATLLIMTSGAAWLGFATHHHAALTLQLAVLPFLPGQLVKIVSAAGIYSALSRWSRS